MTTWILGHRSPVFGAPCITSVLAFFDYLTDGTTIHDRSGNGYSAEIISGTSYADWVIKMPEVPGLPLVWTDPEKFTDTDVFTDASEGTNELITADTDEVFFVDGVPQNVTLANIADESSGGNIRVGDRGLVILSAPQTGACKIKTTDYVGS